MDLHSAAGWLLVVAYVSLVVEMVWFALPSEASTLQVFAGDVEPSADRLGVAQRRTAIDKLVRYLVPTMIGVALFVWPLLVVLWPRLFRVARPLVEAPRVAAVWTGLAIILAGRMLTLAGVVQLRRRHRRGDHQLQSCGVFGLSRNPILLGMFLFYIGNCVWLPAPILWGGFLLYAWNMHARVLMEESYLLARLGADYRSYQARVPRYVGMPRARAEQHEES